MTLVEMYREVRDQFPEISQEADTEHLELYGEIAETQPYVWFESIAKAINRKMLNAADPAIFKELFEFFRYRYAIGDEEIRKCIDVSFTENLFWSVPPSKAQPYWEMLPDSLKDLYVRFHHRKPA